MGLYHRGQLRLDDHHLRHPGAPDYLAPSVDADALGASHGLTSYAAIARYHLATVAELLGDQPRRRSELERARAEFETMGAVGWVRRIDRRLNGLPPE